MKLAICSLASGSSGNCYLVRSESTALLVDAGISAKQIAERLKLFGLEIRDISTILITHEHSDHIKGLEVLAKQGITITANEKTLKAIPKLEGKINCVTVAKSSRPGTSR